MTTLASALQAAFGLTPGFEGVGPYEEFDQLFGSGSLVTDNDPNEPRAYIGLVFLDEDFQSFDFQYQLVSDAAATSDGSGNHEQLNLEFTVPEAGYVFAYFSNESDYIVDVYFDDFSIKHQTLTDSEEDDRYRYAFNGKEKDKSFGLTHYDYGFRIYNPAVSRFLSVDPLASSYPWYTPYQFAGNTPIQAIDLDGAEPLSMITYYARVGAYGPVPKKIVSGTEDGSIALVEGTWNFFTNYAWKRETWKQAGLMLEEIILSSSPQSNIYSPNTPRLDAAVQQFENDVVYGDAYTRSKYATEFGLGVVLGIIGDKGISKLRSLTFLGKVGKVDKYGKLYRVQGGSPPNASKVRFTIKDDVLSIEGEDMLFVTFDDEARAMQFLAKRGDDAYLFEAKVNRNFIERIKKDAVDQMDGKTNPGKPQRVDQNVTENSFGIPKEYFNDLLNNIEDY